MKTLKINGKTVLKQVFIQTYVDADFFNNKNMNSKGRVIHNVKTMDEAKKVVDTKYPNVPGKFKTLSLLEYINGKAK